eukprot:gb/GECH01006122.1/.p1 GENE.gb/GECH01006122.1/~~gb/GECH01006122.1/.p1  ORF type:complete len:197 (+),score=35.29 gb/GECH01006122.1/:1-591(+)
MYFEEDTRNLDENDPNYSSFTGIFRDTYIGDGCLRLTTDPKLFNTPNYKEFWDRYYDGVLRCMKRKKRKFFNGLKASHNEFRDQLLLVDNNYCHIAKESVESCDKEYEGLEHTKRYPCDEAHYRYGLCLWTYMCGAQYKECLDAKKSTSYCTERSKRLHKCVARVTRAIDEMSQDPDYMESDLSPTIDPIEEQDPF